MSEKKKDDRPPVAVAYDKKKAETDKAILYVMGNREVWLPRSQITLDDGELVHVKAWLAEKNGLQGV